MGAWNLRCVRPLLLSGLPPLPDASRAGECEFVECVAPAHDALALDEACGLVGALAGFVPPGGALAGALVLDVDDRQPEPLDDGVVAGEVPAGLGDLAHLVVRALAAVVGVEQLAPGGHERSRLWERRARA